MRSRVRFSTAVCVLLGSSLLLSAGARAAAPLYGAWGLDLTAMDPHTRPGDDFFRHANGAWLERTAIPADKPMYSLRLAMTDLTNTRLHQLLESVDNASPTPATTPEKVGAFYHSFMDERHIEQLGRSSLDPLLAEVKTASSRGALARLMGRNPADVLGTMFDVSIEVDHKDPTRYAVTLYQDGLGLPNRDYYLEPGFAGPKAAYQAYVEAMLRLIDWPDPAPHAAAIVQLETAIARVSWTAAERRDVAATYNAMTVDELARFAPGFDWTAFLAGAGLADVKRVVVAEKSAFPKIAALYAAAPVEDLQAWLAFSAADNAAPYLSRAFSHPYFEFREKTLSGQQEEMPRWQRAVRTVSGGDALAGNRIDSFGNMGWAVGELYCARYFPPEAKAKIEAMVANLKAAYRHRLQRLDWMSDATKAQALRKLATYTIKVGYPDKPRDYSGLTIRADDCLGNVRRAAAADWAFHVGRLNGPVDRADWIMTPQTNDAYNGDLRDIAFPAGILQPPVFDPAADPAINYGAAGAIIGHELTHGFDDQGRKLDAEGKLRDWWAPADAKIFVERAAKLSAQYSRFEPLPGVHVNGALTLGENIADLGGLVLALDAYHASLQGQPAPVLDGVTGDQRVFLGWAQAWCGKYRDAALRKMVVTDPHSPRQFRVNGPIRNIDAWYDAFGVKPDDALYLAPADRVRIW